jgi:hypothetical protein
MKNIIQVWTQKTDYANNIYYWGLGDLIRGTIKLYKLSKRMNFNLLVNIQLHPISNCLKQQNSEYDDLIISNKDNIKYITLGKLEEYIESSTEDILYFLTTDYCDDDITDDCKQFIKDILEPNEELNNLLETFLSSKEEDYEIFHCRLGDNNIKNDVSTKIIEDMDRILDKYRTCNDIFMCDSKYYKNHLSTNKPEICILDLDIGHLGYETDEIRVKNTMFEFFIISRSKNIKTYSNYYWISGFVFWLGKIYDINVVNIKTKMSEYETEYCKKFIDDSIDNKKGCSFEKRFIDIMSDPNNYFITACPDAGQIKGDYVILHNGLKVLKDSYYGEFSKILILNKGCHEPAEERMFELILQDIDCNSTMIELGSYWAFYTMWFNKKIMFAKNYCIEPDETNLNAGKENCRINNVTADFTQAFIGKNNLNLCDFIKEKGISYIDLLHSDIQGFELEMLEDITELLLLNRIKYLFISTHSDTIHYSCIDLLQKSNYIIIASSDFETETFCYDGIIVACHITNQRFGRYCLGNRRHTKLVETE